MKLVFPNGEHGQVELKPGKTTIGSDDGCEVVLRVADVAAHHAEIVIDESGAEIGVKDATNITRVNGSLVAPRARLKGGDALLFASVQCQVVGISPGLDARAASEADAPARDTSRDQGHTRVRRAVPMFVLRGVSGTTFGKNFPLHGSTVVGRHSECDICLPSEEISRRHARVEVTTDGLYVEDMESANGTFVNGKRVRRSKIEPGDELKLDTVRFLVQGAGSDSPPAENKSAKKPAPSKPAAPVAEIAMEDKKAGGSGAVKWAILLTVVIGGAVLALKLRGMI